MSISNTLKELGLKSPFSSDYVEPKLPSNYLKLIEGQHLFRILSKKDEVLNYFVEFIDGEDGKTKKVIYPDLGDGSLPNIKAKSVWAMLVFCKIENRVKIWECSQKKIQKYLFAIVTGKLKNDWTKYDIQITRTGSTMENTEYNMITGDNEELEENDKIVIQKDLEKIDILKMLTGEDPFKKD
jgi:hypothetical protein